jgi:hypothetical protein
MSDAELKPIPQRQHLQSLFDAYVTVTGRVLTLSHARMQTLREFDRRGFTPDDVRRVLGELDRRVRNLVKGYTAASLDWANAMGDVDRFEERLALIRQASARKRGAIPAADVPHTRTLPDGSSVSILAPDAREVDPEAIAAEAKRLTKDLEEKLYGK